MGELCFVVDGGFVCSSHTQRSKQGVREEEDFQIGEKAGESLSLGGGLVAISPTCRTSVLGWEGILASRIFFA